MSTVPQTTRPCYCTKCGTPMERPLWRGWVCHPCKKAASRVYCEQRRTEKAEYDRQYREKNIERITEQKRLAYQEMDEAHRAAERERGRRYTEQNREKERERLRQYKHEHPDRRKATVQRYYETHKEEHMAAGLRWKRANPDKTRAMKQRRRAAKAGAGGQFTDREWQALCALYNHSCLCCGRAGLPLTADHVLPVSLGGSSWIDNIQPLCGPCNSRKGDKHTDYRPSSTSPD